MPYSKNTKALYIASIRQILTVATSKHPQQQRKLASSYSKKGKTMSMDSKKSNKIRDIVRLQQIIKKWRKLANTSSNTSSSNSKSIKFLKRTLSLSDNTIREGSSSAVPKGYLAVCVGDELKRFIIPTEYLSHHAFQILLQEAEEEFGFQQSGVLRIPCEVPVFETILKVVEGKKDIFFTQECILNIEEMVGYCSSESQLTHSHHPQSPMCR